MKIAAMTMPAVANAVIVIIGITSAPIASAAYPITGKLSNESRMNRSGFDAASFCEKDGDYGQALPGRAA